MTLDRHSDPLITFSEDCVLLTSSGELRLTSLIPSSYLLRSCGDMAITVSKERKGDITKKVMLFSFFNEPVKGQLRLGSFVIFISSLKFGGQFFGGKIHRCYWLAFLSFSALDIGLPLYLWLGMLVFAMSNSVGTVGVDIVRLM